MVLDLVGSVLESIGASYALIGGQAVALRGHPRLTLDYDFLTSDRRVFDPEVWKPLEPRAKADIRKGDFDDPLAGVVHVDVHGEGEADVIVAKWKWEERAIERAERMQIQGFSVPVARASDLILLKLAAGGFLDLQDAHALLAAGGRAQLAAEVEAELHELPADARSAWTAILEDH